jgi:hypothetical protein
MRTKTLRLVTPGVQRNGQAVTAAHLAQAVESYNPGARPPVSLGHPKDSAVLALGRAAAPRIVDGSLVLEIQYTPVLEKLEDEGYLEGFSAGLYPHPETGKFYIHHVAALGELPPAADTAILASADLGQFDPAKVVTLAATVEADMTKEEILDAVKAGLKPMHDKLIELEAKVGKADPAPGSGPTEDAEARKQLAVALGTIKGDRIQTIAAGLKAKGLTDEQAKPLLDLLEAADPLTLADDKPEGPFAKAKAFVAGLSAPDAQDMGRRLELADDTGKAIDLGDLARKF